MNHDRGQSGQNADNTKNNKMETKIQPKVKLAGNKKIYLNSLDMGSEKNYRVYWLTKHNESRQDLQCRVKNAWNKNNYTYKNKYRMRKYRMGNNQDEDLAHILQEYQALDWCILN